MTYITNSVIEAVDYNALGGVTRTAAASAAVAAEKAGYLWGIGYGDRGYGQSQSTAPNIGARSVEQPISRHDTPFWSTLNRLCNWQGTSTADLPTEDQTVSGYPAIAFTRGVYIQNHDFRTGALDPWATNNSANQSWSVVSGTDRNGNTKSILQSVAIAGATTQGRFANIAIPHSVGSTMSLPGKTIRARAWAKRVSGNGQAQMTLVFRNNGTLNGGSSTVSTTSSDWTLLEVTATIPADTTRIDFEFRNPGDSAETTSQFDDAQIFLESSAQSIPDLLRLLDTNRLNYDIGNMTLTSSAASTTRASSWVASLTCEFSVTFASEDAARYFFNTGGEIRIALDHPSTATSQDTSWNTVLDDLVVAFRANTSTRLSGSTGTAQAVGYYQLTTSYQDIHIATNVGGGAYSSNDYTISAKALSQTSVVNGSKGSVIWFRVQLLDQHSNVFFDQVSAGTNAVVSHLRATATGSTLLTTAIASPTVTVEQAFAELG